MKPQLIIFAIIIAGFIGYNLFFEVQDEKTNTVINLLYGSILFGYIGYIAYIFLKKLKK